jgi:hypothetical protein
MTVIAPIINGQTSTTTSPVRRSGVIAPIITKTTPTPQPTQVSQPIQPTQVSQPMNAWQKIGSTISNVIGTIKGKLSNGNKVELITSPQKLNIPQLELTSEPKTPSAKLTPVAQEKVAPAGEKVNQALSTVQKVVDIAGDIPISTIYGFFTGEKVSLSSPESIKLREFFDPKEYVGGRVGKSIAADLRLGFLIYFQMAGMTPRVNLSGPPSGYNPLNALKGGTVGAGISTGLNVLAGEPINKGEAAGAFVLGGIFGYLQPDPIRTATKQELNKAYKELEYYGFSPEDSDNAFKAKWKRVLGDISPDKIPGGFRNATPNEIIEATIETKRFNQNIEIVRSSRSGLFKIPDLIAWAKKQFPGESMTGRELMNVEQPPEIFPGEYTPDEVLAKVVGTPLQNTPDGRELVKAALTAQQQGQSIKISEPASQPQPVGGEMPNTPLLTSSKGSARIKVKGNELPSTVLNAGNQLSIDGRKLNTAQLDALNSTLKANGGSEIGTKSTPIIISGEELKMAVTENPKLLQNSEIQRALNVAQQKTSNLPTSNPALQGGNINGQLPSVGNITTPSTKLLSPSGSTIKGGMGGVPEGVKPPEIKPKVVSVPKEQLPVGEGKVKASRLEARMKGVIGQATEEQIKDLGLSTYNVMNKDDQVTKASQYVVNNQQEALDVLQGKVEPPKGIIPESIYVALDQLARHDFSLATKLETLQATALGQRISILSEINKNSPTRTLNERYQIKEATFKKTHGGKPIEEVTNKIAEKEIKEIRVPKLTDWGDIIKLVRCPI